MRPGEQQVAETIDGIRADHVARYKLATHLFGDDVFNVLDVGCGVGYGARLMVESFEEVVAVDIDEEAIEYAKKHYTHEKVVYLLDDAENIGPYDNVDAAVCFECIEHIRNPLPVLRQINKSAEWLLASVPNESVFPHRGKVLYHHRHYTPMEFESLLNESGYEVIQWWGQEGPESDPVENLQGRTIIAFCERQEKPTGGTAAMLPTPPDPIPQSVAIVAMGRSCSTYVRQCAAAGNRRIVADETWAVNSMGNAIEHDILFHMDDVEIQERRADLNPQSNIANMMRWLKDHPKFFTSRVKEGYPGAMEYPLEEIVRKFGITYFNSTVAYAIAYAIYIGVKKLTLYGCDYSYENLHKAERGRGCVEFWLGLAAQRGIAIVVAEDSTLLDACVPPREKFYGYDAYDLEIKQDDEKGISLTKTSRDTLPSAEEIERRYSHVPIKPGKSKEL